jgi:glutamyl-tRNA synthetase
VSFHGKDMSDPVLIREDGTPLYHICSVIDDIDFGITHVVRGEDHVTNTACHVQMFEALGAKVPEFAHLPLLSDAQGGKLSKRLGSLSVQSLRNDEQIEPMSIISFLARLGTSDPIEAYADAQPLIESFDFSKFSKGAPKCDEEEIYRLNAKIIRDMPYSVAVERLEELGLNDSVVSEDYWMAVRPNLSKFNELKMWVDVTHGQVDAELSAEDQDYVEMVRGLLPAGPWDDQTWSKWIAAIKEQTDRKGKALFMPLRLALTGMNHGPELDKMLPILGEEKVLDRLSLKSKAA